MAYQLEADPRLMSPDYWGGVDIMNPDHLAGLPEEPSVPNRQSRKLAQRALTGCLDEVLATDRFHEASLALSGEIEPTIPDLPQGTTIILDTEYLSKQTYLPSAKKAERVIDLDATAISDPFTSYWRQNQLSGTTRFGDEQAFFDTEGVEITYTRALQWGVMARSKRGLPVLRTWQFATPRTQTGKLVVPKPEGTEKFPPDINYARPIPFINLGNSGIVGIARIRDARAVAKPRPREGNTHELNIEQLVRNTLANAGIGVRLQPVPIRI